MPLLEAGRPIEDRYCRRRRRRETARRPGADPARAPAGRASTAGRNAELGVLVPSTTRPEDLAPLLDRVSLVAIDFPKFRDGRGFTIARTLRERYGYTGEIRAVGGLLPDQHSHALRCGFSTVAVADGRRPWPVAGGATLVQVPTSRTRPAELLSGCGGSAPSRSPAAPAAVAPGLGHI